MTSSQYLASRRALLLAQTLEHANIVLMSVALATVIGVLIGIATYRHRRARAIAVAIAAAILTIPSFALLGLMIAPLGLGYVPALVALSLYALLPIIRNTVVGLTGIDPALAEAARGIGMSRLRSLATVELPLAWPVILIDDKPFFPIYNPALTVNGATAARYPGLVKLLDPITAKLDDATLRRLNEQVDVKGELASTVAADWMRQQGFIG